MVCRKCGKEFEGNFCSGCGSPSEETKFGCLECGNEYSGDFCPECGTRRGQTTKELCEHCGEPLGDKFTPCPACGGLSDEVREFSRHRNAETVTAGILSVLMWSLTVLFFSLHKTTLSVFVALLCLAVATGSAVIVIVRLFNRSDVDATVRQFERWQHTDDVPAKDRPLSRRERIKENHRNAVACCPKCGSTSLSEHKKGFGIGKAFVGAWAVGGLGLVAGNIGAKKVRVTCLNCGKQFWAGKR